MITQTYKLNFQPNGIQDPYVNVSQFDVGSRTIEFTLYDGTTLFEVPDGSTVTVRGTKPDNTGFEYVCSYSGSVVSFDIQDQMTVISGVVPAEIRIVNNGEIIGSKNFAFRVERTPLDPDVTISETTLPLLEEVAQELPQALEDIEWLKENINKVYGIKRSLKTSSSAWERTNDSIGLNANATHDGTAVTNDFDNLYPWCDIKTVNMADNGTINAEIGDANFKFDGSNGEVMTYIPPFYWDRYQLDGYEYIKISNRYFDNAKHSSGFYLGRYTTSSGVHSKSGVVSQVSTNITTFRTQATGKGTGWQQLDYHYFLLEMLYLVEYADYDSQTKLGKGVMSATAQVKSGACDSLGMKSGCTANDALTPVIYRGIENPYGNIWQFVDGLNVKDNVTYLNTNPSSYSVDTFTGDYKQIGYTNSASNGWTKKMGHDANYPIVGLPIEVGGSATTYMCDYYYQNTGNRIALVGGSWADGARVGFFSWHMNSTSGFTYAGLGSRLLKI